MPTTLTSVTVAHLCLTGTASNVSAVLWRCPTSTWGAKVCQNCSPGSTYNPVTKECEDRNGKYINQGPTIEKLIAGIM